MSAYRNKERGSIVVVAMMVLVALISLGGLTTLSVQGGLASSGHDRFQSVALYAAEGGAAVGMDYLRRRINAATHPTSKLWSAYVNANNAPAYIPVDLPGNGIQPGQAGNPFSADMRAWYEVEILNNREDDGFATGDDLDGRVILRATGHGPNGTVAQIEWDVKISGPIGLGRACSKYAQGGQDADGAGVNDCMTTVDHSQTSQVSINSLP